MALPRGRGEGDAGVGDAAPFLLDLLALRALQAAEEIGEVGIGLGHTVAPVELDRAAHRPAGLDRRGLVGGVEEQEVRRGEAGLARDRLDAAQQQQALLVRRRQQARPGHRRERDRTGELGVVVEAMASVGIGPGPVEHVLAVRVVLEIERTRGDELAGVFEQQEVRRPAGVGDGTGRSVQGAQVLERDEGRGARLAREQGVPAGGIDLGRVAADDERPAARFALAGEARGGPGAGCLQALHVRSKPRLTHAARSPCPSRRVGIGPCL